MVYKIVCTVLVLYVLIADSMAYANYTNNKDNITGGEIPNRFIDVLAKTANDNNKTFGGNFILYIIVFIFTLILLWLFKILRGNWK